jgi:superfamily II DNA or RNA helicase
MMVVDEAHELRTGGSNFEAIKYLRDLSLSVLALSATPFYTSSRVSINNRFKNIHSSYNFRISGILVAFSIFHIFSRRKQTKMSLQPIR